MSHRLWKYVWVGALPFKSIIFEGPWKVLNVLNRYFKNLLKYGPSSKKLKHFHIPPVLFAHSDTKICNMGSHITGILGLFSSKTPVIHDDKLVRRSNRGVTHNVVTLHHPHSASTSCYWRRIRSSAAISLMRSFRSQPKGRTGYTNCVYSGSQYLVIGSCMQKWVVWTATQFRGFPVE